MRKFTVIWRGADDDFSVTEIEMQDDIQTEVITTNDWADMAHRIETEGWDEEDVLESMPSVIGYELIGVFEGEVRWIR